jgi:hypothetical protein
MIKKIKTYKLFTESLPFDSYPGPPVISKPSDYINFLYADDNEVEPISKYGQGFSFPYDTEGPAITRFSGDGKGKIGIKGGPQGGRIGGGFDTNFSPGGEIERDMSDSESVPTPINSDNSPEKERMLDFLKLINEV